MSFYRNIRIAGTGSYAPSRIVTNEELEKSVGTNTQWIFENLGILERRIAEKEEYTSDLAVQAGLKAIENAGLEKDDIELIILATATPDRKAPSAACIVQQKLGIRTHCPAFDISAVCSGFIYGLTIGSQFIQSGTYKNILVIGADTFSKITDWSRRDCVFFGDGAGAVVLQTSDSKEALFSSLLFANGQGQDHFTIYPKDEYFTMNGRAVYETGSVVLPQAIRSVLQKNNLTPTDISMIIPHQPSIRILKNTANELGIPFDRVMTNMDRFANTSGGTIPILLDEAHRGGKIKRNDLIVFAAVGSGWTWGAAIYRWL